MGIPLRILVRPSLPSLGSPRTWSVACARTLETNKFEENGVVNMCGSMFTVTCPYSVKIKPHFTPAIGRKRPESTQIKKSTCNPPSTGQYWEYSTLDFKGVLSQEAGSRRVKKSLSTPVSKVWLVTYDQSSVSGSSARPSLEWLLIEHVL